MSPVHSEACACHTLDLSQNHMVFSQKPRSRIGVAGVGERKSPIPLLRRVPSSAQVSGGKPAIRGQNSGLALQLVSPLALSPFRASVSSSIKRGGGALNKSAPTFPSSSHQLECKIFISQTLLLKQNPNPGQTQWLLLVAVMTGSQKGAGQLGDIQFGKSPP